MRPIALTLIGMFVAGSGIARAAGIAPTRLRYERRPGAESCPDEAQLREAIAIRLGSDPFNSQGKRLMEITVGVQGEGLEARIGVVGENGVTTGQRDLRSKSRACQDLSAVLVLTATMVLDPPLASEAVEAPRTPVTPHEAAAVAATSITAVEEAPSASGLEAGLAVVGQLGTVSSPSLGFSLQLGFAWSVFSLAIEGQTNVPVHEELSGGSVTSSQLTGTLVPCFTQWHLGGCALISAGATRVTASGVEPTGNHSLPYFALGARVYAGLPLVDWLEARVLVDLLIPLTQTSIVLDQSTSWAAPPVSGSVALALVTRFR